MVSLAGNSRNEEVILPAKKPNDKQNNQTLVICPIIRKRLYCFLDWLARKTEWPLRACLFSSRQWNQCDLARIAPISRSRADGSWNPGCSVFANVYPCKSPFQFCRYLYQWSRKTKKQRVTARKMLFFFQKPGPCFPAQPNFRGRQLNKAAQGYNSFF